MDYRGRTPNKEIARAKLDEFKRQLDAMRVQQISDDRAAAPTHEVQMKNLDEQYEMLKERAEAAFSGADDRVAALAADFDRALEDFADGVKRLWDGFTGDGDDTSGR